MNRQYGGSRLLWLQVAATAIIVCAFFIAPSSAAGYVIVAQYLASSEHARIVVKVEGKPFANAKIMIYRHTKETDKLRYTLVTDGDGLVVMPRLRAGKYRLSVTGEPGLWGDLYLEVSDATSSQASQFTVNLEAFPYPSQEDALTAAEKAPIKDVLQTFSGVIVDATGALIPGTSIDVVRKGTEGKVHAARVRSDAQGKFSADLRDGDYIAIFRAKGFSECFVPFTISRANGTGQLQVRLNIGLSS